MADDANNKAPAACNDPEAFPTCSCANKCDLCNEHLTDEEMAETTAQGLDTKCRACRSTTIAATNLFADAEIISQYTRAQALEEGCLVDVSEVALEAGFRWPVALTRNAFEKYVAWTDEDRKRAPGALQDESGRLWDVLWMAFLQIRVANRSGNKNDQLLYKLMIVPRTGRKTTAREAVLKIIVGPDDAGDPCITIMLPEED
jgi:hypothetical protein